MDDAITFSAEKWLYFCTTLVFTDDVPLVDRVGSFLIPIREGLASNVGPLKNAPDAVILLIVAKGIEKSGTHSRSEIEEALGVPLPD